MAACGAECDIKGAMSHQSAEHGDLADRARDGAESQKRASNGYEMPKLIELGTVAELTQMKTTGLVDGNGSKAFS